MRSVAELKQDLLISQNLGDIVDVLKSTATIQLRTFQSKQEPDEDFLNETQNCLNVLSARASKHPYLFRRKGLPSAIVVISSDEGFLGELNTMLINTAMDRLKNKEDKIVVLGLRGENYLHDMGKDFVSSAGISDEVAYKEAEKLKNYLLKDYHRKTGSIEVVYPEFISITVQRVKVLSLLPYAPDEPLQKNTDREKESVFLLKEEDTIFEPSICRAMEVLIDLHIGFKLFQVFWSSKLSEFSARIMHLEGSTQELSHLNRKLSLEYFRQVHALRDKVIREISAAKLQMGKNQ
jgi:ATP synthase F1 gamma subunit